MVSTATSLTLSVHTQEQKLVFRALSKSNFFVFFIAFFIFILYARKVRSHIWDRGVERVGVFAR